MKTCIMDFLWYGNPSAWALSLPKSSWMIPQYELLNSPSGGKSATMCPVEGQGIGLPAPTDWSRKTIYVLCSQ